MHRPRLFLGFNFRGRRTGARAYFVSSSSLVVQAAIVFLYSVIESWPIGAGALRGLLPNPYGSQECRFGDFAMMCPRPLLLWFVFAGFMLWSAFEANRLTARTPHRCGYTHPHNFYGQITARRIAAKFE